ncbi:unnamed protein product [Cyprideis torosa]|uniref:Uncharacterized protein n=1 Tax=Cyprideis torosa TaxID=163714 RepID=A0A7R8ZXL7_9CRUS|nr:unnamed protein product [Cyprideis torosa]CAG0910444.1 unnamed protein product [Cyprideis torosa]
MYLFENYFDEDETFEPDRNDLEFELIEAGFGNSLVSQAFDWLEELGNMAPVSKKQTKTNSHTRIYTSEEQERLGASGIGTLTFLEHNGVMDFISRERIVDRIMALDSDDIDSDQLKWVVLMVLLNRPEDDQHANLAWLEELVYDDRSALPH